MRRVGAGAWFACRWAGCGLVRFDDSAAALLVTCETAAVDVPEVSFVDADGVSIAWQQFGSGPDVLAVPALVSNIEIFWEHEFFRRFFEYIARHVRVTVFDKRGMGLSDKFHDPPTLGQRTTDILAVMD